MNSADLRSLKTPLVVLGVTIACAIGVPYYIDVKLDEAKRELTNRQQALRVEDTRLQKSGQEKDVIVRYLKPYEQLERLGFVGEEQRINWLEGLRLTNQQTQLFGVDYQIGAQQPYPESGRLNPGQLSLYQSVMRVSFRLLHEGDLQRFLTALAKQGAGVFTVNQCVLERLDTSGSIRFQPNLRAECDLAWITVRPTPSTLDRK